LAGEAALFKIQYIGRYRFFGEWAFIPDAGMNIKKRNVCTMMSANRLMELMHGERNVE
jgi:hypothetical protein